MQRGPITQMIRGGGPHTRRKDMAMSNLGNEIRIHGHVIRWSAVGARWEVWRGGQVVGRKERLREAIDLARGMNHVNS